MKPDHITFLTHGFKLFDTTNGKHTYVRDNVQIVKWCKLKGRHRPDLKVEISLPTENFITTFRNNTKFENVESWIEKKERDYKI